MHVNCRCKRWLTGACRSCGEQVARERRREGIERKHCEAGAKRWENGRTDGGSTLSTGSLGHSYASAVRTITAKPHQLRKMPHIRPNSSIDTDTRVASQYSYCSTTRRVICTEIIVLGYESAIYVIKKSDRPQIPENYLGKHVNTYWIIMIS